MVYGPRKKKISQFTAGSTLTDDTKYSSLQDGINKTFTQEQILENVAEVYGASLRMFEFESDLILSDIQIDEHCIVEENRYTLYKITSAAANLPNIALDSGFTAERVRILQQASPSTYAEILAENPDLYAEDDVIYLSGDGIAGDFKVVASAISASSTGVLLSNATWNAAGKHLARVYNGDLYSSWWGALGNSTDDTDAIQAALDYAESLGGGNVWLPDGTVYLSVGVRKYCLAIPEGCSLLGSGRDKAVVQRLPAERDVDGVLIVNKGYDTTGNYGAAGNILIKGFELTDGNATPTRALGDLIGIGHGKNITITEMHFGNHDQHAVDICSCSGVYIYNNIGVNNAGVTGSAATIQIDCAFGLGIWGLHISVDSGGGTYAEATENIHIWGNRLDNKTSPVIQLCHAEWSRYNNIIIRDNPWLSAGYSASAGGDSIIELDEVRRWAHLKTLKILNNGLQGNHPGAILINLFSDKDLSTFDDIEIAHNYGVIEGDTGLYDSGVNKYSTTGLAFVYVGNSAAFTSAASGRDQNFHDVNIHDNNVILTSTSINSKLVTMYNVNGKLASNFLQYTAEDRINQPVVLLDTPRGIEVSGNKLRVDTATGAIGADSAAIWLHSNLSSVVSERKANIHHNDLGCDNVAYGYNQGLGTWNPFVDEIIFSGNTFSGTPLTAHIQEFLPTSDGTNGWHQIDLGGTDGWLALSAALTSAHNTGLKKLSTKSYTKFHLQYVSVASATNFRTNVEEMQHAYISATEWVGTQIAQVNQQTGVFVIVTGSDGVSMVINDTSHEPVIRTGGALKVWAGI